MGNFQNALDAKRRLAQAKNQGDINKAEKDLEDAREGLPAEDLAIIDGHSTYPQVEAVEVPGGKWQIAQTYVCPHCGVIMRLAGGATAPGRCAVCWLSVGAPT